MDYKCTEDQKMRARTPHSTPLTPLLEHQTMIQSTRGSSSGRSLFDLTKGPLETFFDRPIGGTFHSPFISCNIMYIQPTTLKQNGYVPIFCADNRYFSCQVADNI